MLRGYLTCTCVLLLCSYYVYLVPLMVPMAAVGVSCTGIRAELLVVWRRLTAADVCCIAVP